MGGCAANGADHLRRAGRCGPFHRAGYTAIRCHLKQTDQVGEKKIGARLEMTAEVWLATVVRPYSIVNVNVNVASHMRRHQIKVDICN